MVVVTQPSSKKISSQTILRETPKLWLQHYHSSISPQNIKRIVTSDNRLGLMHDASGLIVVMSLMVQHGSKPFASHQLTLHSQFTIISVIKVVLSFPITNKTSIAILSHVNGQNINLCIPKILPLLNALRIYCTRTEKEGGHFKKLLRCTN